MELAKHTLSTNCIRLTMTVCFWGRNLACWYYTKQVKWAFISQTVILMTNHNSNPVYQSRTKRIITCFFLSFRCVDKILSYASASCLAVVKLCFDSVVLQPTLIGCRNYCLIRISCARDEFACDEGTMIVQQAWVWDVI